MFPMFCIMNMDSATLINLLIKFSVDLEFTMYIIMLSVRKKKVLLLPFPCIYLQNLFHLLLP